MGVALLDTFRSRLLSVQSPMAPPKQLRPNQLNVRLSDQEDEQVRCVAESRGLTAAALARMLLLAEVKRARQEERKAVGS